MGFLGSSPHKPVVAIDVDGTICDYHGHFVEFARNYLNMPDLKPDWSISREFSEALGLEKSVYRQCKLAYRQGGMKRTIPMWPGAKELVDAVHAAGAEVWFCTTRPWERFDSTDPDTRHFFERNDLDWNGVIYGDNKYQDLCEIVGRRRIVCVIDDEPVQIDKAKDLGLHVMLRHLAHNFGGHQHTGHTSLAVLQEIVVGLIDIWKERNGMCNLEGCQINVPHGHGTDDSNRGEFGMPGVGVDYEKVSAGFRLTDAIRLPEPPRSERVCNIFDEAQTLYRRKAAGYGDTANNLGAKGQFADINRKVGKLQHTLWEGNEVVGESIEEMLMDLMGHCALTIDFLRNEESK